MPLSACVPAAVARHASLIEAAAREFRVPADLLAALVIQESGGNEHATRYESSVWTRYVQGNPRWDAARRLGWSDALLSSSVGLVQVLGITAWDLGAHDTPAAVMAPQYNLRLGAKYLRRQYDTFQTWRVALMAYNGGPGAGYAAQRGEPINEGYAAAVLAHRAQIVACREGGA